MIYFNLNISSNSAVHTDFEMGGLMGKDKNQYCIHYNLFNNELNMDYSITFGVY